MTGLFSTINSATAGLAVVQSNLKLVSDNVARADDPTRTRHELKVQNDPSGSVVGVAYTRRMDQALNNKLGEAISEQGSAEAVDTYMRRIGDLLGLTTGEATLTSALQDFDEAWQALETTPESATAHQRVIDTGTNLAHQVRSIAGNLEDIDRSIRDDIGAQVDDINGKLDQISDLNKRIISINDQPVHGDASSTLRDQRDQLVRELNELIGVKTVDQANGGLAVLTPTGLSLVDVEPVKLSFDGETVTLEGRDRDLEGHLRTGSLGALVRLVKDGSQADPPKAASTDPTEEVIRKLRSQLDAIAGAFTDKTVAGEPTSFADAYANATPTEDTELTRQFFTGTDRFSFAIDERLQDGTLDIKQAAIADTAAAVKSDGRTLTADGLSSENATYEGFVADMMGLWSKAGDDAIDALETETEIRELVEERYYNKVGINLDEEIAALQSLQTSYAATARVFQVANRLFDTLEGIVG